MMSGLLVWHSSNLFDRGTHGYFWASTPTSYANSRYLYFNSTNVGPKNNDHKPSGFPLRCVAPVKLDYFKQKVYNKKIYDKSSYRCTNWPN